MKSNKYGLKNQTIEQINAVFSKCEKINTAILYGSRSKGNFRPGSDIDLTLKGNNLDLKILNKICYELDNLLLPYTFDLSLYDHIKNPDLIEHIKRVGKVFYQAIP